MTQKEFTPRLQYTDQDIVSVVEIEPFEGTFSGSGAPLVVPYAMAHKRDMTGTFCKSNCWDQAIMIQARPTRCTDHALICLELLCGIWGGYTIDANLDCFDRDWRWPQRFIVKWGGGGISFDGGSGQGRTLCEAICRSIVRWKPGPPPPWVATDEELDEYL